MSDGGWTMDSSTDAPAEASRPPPAESPPAWRTTGPVKPYPVAPPEPRPTVAASRGQTPIPRSLSPAPAATIARRRPAPPPSYVAEGLVCLFVAALWAPLVQYCYHEIGTMVFMRNISVAMGLAMKNQSPETRASSGGPNGGRSAQLPRAVSILPTPTAIRQVAPKNMQAAPPRSGPHELLRDPPDRSQSEEARAAVRTIWAEGTRIVWSCATFVIIGLIVVTGVAACVRGAAGRLAIQALICLALGATAGGVVVAKYMSPAYADAATSREFFNKWGDFLLTIAEGRHAWVAHVFAASLGAAFFGLFALRPDSQSNRWIAMSIAAMIGATFMSLGGISMLETYARFPPMPSWAYGCIAAGQSLFAWILLIMLGRHPTTADERA